MGKTFKSETKIPKANEKHKRNRKRWASKEKKLKNISHKNSSKLKRIFNMFDLFSEPSLEDRINSLDDPTKKIFNIDTNSEFRINFPSDVNNRKFSELFLKGLNSTKNNFSQYNLKILKKILLELNKVKGNNTIGDEFGLESCQNNLQKVFRKDLVFSLLSDESKVKELEKEGLNKVETKLKQTIEYNLFVNNSVYSNSFIYNENNNGLYSFDKFKNLLLSPVILQAYKEVIEELYDVKKSKQEIKNVIKEYLKKHSIYFVLINIEYYGMILYDGTILLNQAYYGLSYTDRNAFIIFFTLLHEIMHALSRLIRNDDNYLLNTAEFTKAKKKVFTEESGSYFENKLLLSALKGNKLTSYEAKYLLDLNNYQYNTIDDFKKAFIDFKNKNKEKIKKLQSFFVGKGSNDDVFEINIGCYCAGRRNNYK